MEKVFFKIIISNYNNMAYIKRCFDSILQQTFQDFKIVVVDDLSTDNSDKICELYARKFPSKIVYRQLEKKGYAGAARNYGLDYEIDCQYVWFVDSDDWLHGKNALQMMHDKIVQTYPDILRCPYINYYSKACTRVEVLKTDIDSIMKNGAAPYKNCINAKFQKCKFKELRSKCNDVIWFLRLYDLVDLKKIVTLQSPVYVYNRGSTTSCQNSILHKINIVNIKSELALIDDLATEVFSTAHCKKAQSRISSIVQHQYKSIDCIDISSKGFVISIDQKQYSQFYKIFKAANLKIPALKIGSTIKDFSGPRNCTESHMSIIQHAKKSNWPYVLVFEDDAYPCIDLAKNIQGYLSCIPNKASLVMLGWSNVNIQRQSFSSPYNKITSTLSGSHAYIVFKQGYDDIIKLYNKNPNSHYDCDILCKVPNAYICHKPLFIQYSMTTSMNKHRGYILYGDHVSPPKDFQDIKTLLHNN